jgi:hypothetical protein
MCRDSQFISKHRVPLESPELASRASLTLRLVYVSPWESRPIQQATPSNSSWQVSLQSDLEKYKWKLNTTMKHM